jgi:tetratricopeptide (TPR) repeat protein
VEAIATETDGNPFFIREVLLYLLEEGKLYRDDGRWTTSLAIADVGIPEGVRQVIGRRLARLSESARRLLSAASAFDGAFPFAVATRAAGVDETDALDALDEALTAQLVQPAADPDGYEFSHALIRHTLYEEINPSRRVRLHRDIAVALEEAFAGQLDAREMEVAHHYREAGQIADPQAVATHCLRAGSRAYAAFSYAEAIRNWEAGLAASARLPGFPPLERALALRDLARALHVSGRGRGAEFAIIDEALALFRELGTNELVAEALVFRSGMHSMNLRAREALADIEAARELMDAGSGQPPSPSALRLRSRILEQLCQRYTMIRRYSRAESVAAEALRVAQEVHDSALVAEAHLARALCLFQWLRMRDAVAAFDDCLAAAAVHAQGAGYAAWPFAEAASNRKALALTGLGRLDDARPLAIEGREFFARIGDPYRLSWARLTLALGAALRGDLAAARAEAETALEEGGAATSGIVAMTVTPVLVHVECLAGDFGSARRHADDLLARQRDEGSASVLPQALAFRALVESAAGNRDEAIRLAQELTIGFNPRTPDLVALLAHVALAEVAVRFRDASIASLVLAPLEELDKQGVVFTLYWPALLPRLLAGLARVLGQHDAARGYLARAIGLASEASAHPELALCNLEAAWLWHDEGAEGDATEVTRKLDQVESIAVEHGLKSLEAPLAEARAALERSLPSS